MSWTYSGDPSASNLDQVRFLIGDTDEYDQQLTDAEINFCIAQNGNLYKAAAEACTRIFAKYSRLVDKSVGDLRLAYSQRRDSYKALQESLLSQATARMGMPSFGGIVAADKQANEADTTVVQPTFKRGQFDEPGANPIPAPSDSDND